MKNLFSGTGALTLGILGLLAAPCAAQVVHWDGSGKTDAPAPVVVPEAVAVPVSAAGAPAEPADKTLEEYVPSVESLADSLSKAVPAEVSAHFRLTNAECRDEAAKSLEARIEPVLDSKEIPGLAAVRTKDEFNRLKSLIKRAQAAHASAVAALSKKLDEATTAAQAEAIVREMREHNHRTTRFGTWLFAMSVK